MAVGGSEKLKESVDFKSAFDTFNEECSVQFLLDAVEQNLHHTLKPKEVYLSKLAELEDLGSIDSMDKFNSMNVHRLHLDEIAILEKNRDYLVQMRRQEI